MRKLLRFAIGTLCVLLALFGAWRIYCGYPSQGLCGIAAAVCLFPPLFDRIRPWRRGGVVTALLVVLGLLVFSPFPGKLQYRNLLPKRSSEPTVNVTTEPTVIARNTPSDIPTEPLLPSPTEEPTGTPASITPVPTSSPTPIPTATPSPIPTVTPSPLPTATPTPVPAEPYLQVICLDVGQGDATLIRHVDTAGREWNMMVDGGDRGTSSFVVARLERLGVSHLDAIVCTHYDADHCFGLIGCYVKYADERTTVYCPDYVADNTVTFQKFKQRLDEGIVSVNHPKPGDRIMFGDCDILVLGPVDVNAELENNRSIVLYLTYQGKTFYLPGDAEKEEESAIVSGGFLPNKNIDVYHASHHGSYSGSSKELLSVLKPKYTVISVGAENPYQHPHDVTLRRIADCGCENVLRTDKCGEITFTVRNGELTVSLERAMTE